MLEPWNDKSVLPPPINTSPCQINFSIKELKSGCNTIIRVLSKQSPLHKESAIFSRFLYKFDKKFRNDIGYRNFKKVYTALRKYLSLTLLKDVQNFIDVLPANNEVKPYLPTRQMLQYILVKIVTFSKLMYRITVCSKQAAIFYLNRIKLGESHWMCLMPYALLCRIWSMVLVLLQHSCNWYNQLYPFLKHLPYKGLDFLPKEYQLPVDLEEWINLKNINQAGRLEWSQKLNVNVESVIMVEDEEGDVSENLLKYVNNINKNKDSDDETEIQIVLPKQDVQSEIVSNEKYDEGVAISRETFKTMMNLPSTVTNPAVSKIKENHAIENVTNRDSLLKFIENEEEFRNKSNDISLTGHLSFMQWQALKMTLLKLDGSLDTRKLEKKFKRIWQAKCLDYV
ncbi:jg21202 [Pararge aegeria aegeria]|uniref:Jg21202 protein n=1 Tax=Pararge aegeria aegeria TaxID=348720 RepID=A0A8S4RG57_9NEOP|nr:jg21202 [Pararge aegeria aegeria]